MHWANVTPLPVATPLYVSYNDGSSFRAFASSDVCCDRSGISLGHSSDGKLMSGALFGFAM